MKELNPLDTGSVRIVSHADRPARHDDWVICPTAASEDNHGGGQSDGGACNR
jgi:hypothetical protein